MASFLPRLKEKMYKHADSLKYSPAIAQLLVKTLEHVKIVDLAPFTHLGAQTMSSIVKELQKHGRMRGINLSNSNIKVEDLMEC